MPDRGALVVSLDLELLWGFHDLPLSEEIRRRCRETRRVTNRLLELFARYEIQATWAAIGHLFLDRAERDARGRPHPDHPRPRHLRGGRDWFASLPEGDARTCPEWYAPDLIARIQEARPFQEIGSHSFSHVVFADPGCDETVARAELARCRQLARSAGIELRSFVFPRNEVGHLALLREAGFEVFRGRETTFYWRLPEPLRKPVHVVDRIFATTPRVVQPRRTPEGVINLPASMLYLPAMGWRRYLPISRRIAQAHKGLVDAARERAVFHLWFHPEGLVEGESRLFFGLDAILNEARSLRAAGRLEVMTMYDAAQTYLT